MKRYFNYLAFLSVLFVNSVCFASFTIMPVKLEINKNNKVATMTLQNDNDSIKNFQLVLYKREYKNGKEEYIETKDLIATPVMFTLHPHKTQLVRIALKNKANYSKKESDYRIAIKELPRKMKLDGVDSKIQLVIQFNVPITIAG